MTKNLLVELGLEELPAYVVTPSEKQLGEKMAAFLDDNRLSYEGIQTFSTPRRLAVRVLGLADQQTDLTEDFKGPSKKIALDADGNFSKAAQGFVRGKGLTVDDIEFREVKGEEYVYVTKHEAGKPAKEVLAGVPEVLASLTFPVSMHWANNTFEYIRPVHTLIVLLGDEALDLDFLDIHSGRVSRGHRFLGHEVEITNADSYEEDLRTVYVIADSKERENMIREQIKAIEAEQGGKERINFIRNSVKVIVDAYNGNVDFYVTDTTDPFISTIMKTYPTLFKNYNELSENIKKQMRYPQYLFDIQAKVLSTYHNTDVDNIYRADDRWEVTEVSGSGQKSSTSMYTILKEGSDLKPAIITTYTPEKRKNIVSYLVGQSENGVNKLTMYRYNEKSELSLSFIDTQIEKDEKVQKEMRELTTLGTELKTVRILLPYEDTTLYIKSIYQVFLNEDSVPVLKKVIVANKGKVGIGNTLKEAMQRMLTENAIDIDVRDLANEDELKDAIIKQNKTLKDVMKQGDFEYTGKDIQRLIKLVDQLEVIF